MCIPLQGPPGLWQGFKVVRAPPARSIVPFPRGTVARTPEETTTQTARGMPPSSRKDSHIRQAAATTISTTAGRHNKCKLLTPRRRPEKNRSGMYRRNRLHFSVGDMLLDVPSCCAHFMFVTPSSGSCLKISFHCSWYTGWSPTCHDFRRKFARSL